MRRVLLALPLLMSLSNCAEYQAAYTGYAKEVKTAAQNVNDDAAQAERDALCALPYSAVQRNVGKVPGFQEGYVKMCGPIGAGSAQ